MNEIARGNGKEINDIASRIANMEGYESMWLHSDKPILKANRRYILWMDESGFLTVSREVE